MVQDVDSIPRRTSISSPYSCGAVISRWMDAVPDGTVMRRTWASENAVKRFVAVLLSSFLPVCRVAQRTLSLPFTPCLWEWEPVYLGFVWRILLVPNIFVLCSAFCDNLFGFDVWSPWLVLKCLYFHLSGLLPKLPALKKRRKINKNHIVFPLRHKKWAIYFHQHLARTTFSPYYLLL